MVRAVRVVPVTAAQEDPADRVTADQEGLVVPANAAQEGLVVRVVRAVPVTAAQAGLVGQEAPVGLADPTTVAGTGARRPRIWRGAAWTRAGSTTNRSTTTGIG